MDLNPPDTDLRNLVQPPTSLSVTQVYLSPEERELQERNKNCKIQLTPWTVQNIVYELLQDHLLKNDPESLGYAFKQKYNLDDKQSNILLAIGHDWKGGPAGKRPAYFVFRDDVQYRHPAMGHRSGIIDAEESQVTKLYMRNMNCSIACIGKSVGFAEALADYAKIPFVTFAEEIKCDFKFRRFRISAITSPRPYTEAVNNYIVVIMIETAFDEGYTIQRDDLKLKTVGRTIFDAILPNVPFTMQ